MAVKGGGGNGTGGGKGIRAGKAFVELTADDAGLRKKLDEAKIKVMRFGKSMAVVGGATLAAGAAVLAPLTAAFKGALDRGTEISRLAQKLGVSTEQLSEFAYAAETTGMSFEDLTGQFENLAERVAQGAQGTGEAAETFKKLGIDAAQLKLKNPIDQMIELARAMQGVTNQTERLGMLSSLGGDQFQWMENLFRMGPEGITRLMSEARDVGASVSSEGAASAVKVQRAFDRAWASIKGLFFSIGEAFLPFADTIESAVSLLVGVTKGVREFIQNNQTLVATIAGIAAVVATIGTVVIGAGAAVAAFGAALGALAPVGAAIGSVLGAVFSPVGLVVAGVVALGVAVAGIIRAFFKFTESGRELGRVLGAGWSMLADIFRTTFGGIVDALRNGDLQGAWDIALQGLTVTWKHFTLGLQQLWNNFKDKIVDGFIYLVAEMKKLLPEAIAGSASEIDAALAANLEARRKAREEALAEAMAEAQAAKEELQRMVDAQAAKRAGGAAVARGEQRDFREYMPRVTERVKGLFQAPNLNQVLGYGDNVKVDQATIQTAKNTGAIVKEIKRLEPATFK